MKWAPTVYIIVGMALVEINLFYRWWGSQVYHPCRDLKKIHQAQYCQNRRLFHWTDDSQVDLLVLWYCYSSEFPTLVSGWKTENKIGTKEKDCVFSLFLWRKHLLFFKTVLHCETSKYSSMHQSSLVFIVSLPNSRMTCKHIKNFCFEPCRIRWIMQKVKCPPISN